MIARKPNARPIVRTDSCRRTCPAGHACVLSDEPHELCICVDEHCACHSQQRYNAVRHPARRNRKD